MYFLVTYQGLTHHSTPFLTLLRHKCSSACVNHPTCFQVWTRDSSLGILSGEKWGEGRGHPIAIIRDLCGRGHVGI